MPFLHHPTSSFTSLNKHIQLRATTRIFPFPSRSLALFFSMWAKQPSEPALHMSHERQRPRAPTPSLSTVGQSSDRAVSSGRIQIEYKNKIKCSANGMAPLSATQWAARHVCAPSRRSPRAVPGESQSDTWGCYNRHSGDGWFQLDGAQLQSSAADDPAHAPPTPLYKLWCICICTLKWKQNLSETLRGCYSTLGGDLHILHALCVESVDNRNLRILHAGHVSPMDSQWRSDW